MRVFAVLLLLDGWLNLPKLHRLQSCTFFVSLYVTLSLFCGTYHHHTSPSSRTILSWQFQAVIPQSYRDSNMGFPPVHLLPSQAYPDLVPNCILLLDSTSLDDHQKQHVGIVAELELLDQTLVGLHYQRHRDLCLLDGSACAAPLTVCFQSRNVTKRQLDNVNMIQTILTSTRASQNRLTTNPFNSLIARAAASGLSYETNPKPLLLPVSFSTIILTLKSVP